MPRLIVGMAMWFGMGIILSETVNQFGIAPFHLPASPLAATFSLLFLIADRLRRRFESKALSSDPDAESSEKAGDGFDFLRFLLALLLLLLIPFLWWGVVRKLATIANEGKKLL